MHPKLSSVTAAHYSPKDVRVVQLRGREQVLVRALVVFSASIADLIACEGLVVEDLGRVMAKAQDTRRQSHDHIFVVRRPDRLWHLGVNIGRKGRVPNARCLKRVVVRHRRDLHHV